MRLGVPLLDAHLAFVGSRCRPNTLLATAFDRERYLPEIESRAGTASGRSMPRRARVAPGTRRQRRPRMVETPLWVCISYALTLYTRAVAERLNIYVQDLARHIAQRRGIDLQQPAQK